MKILAIETSCDETAIAIVDCVSTSVEEQSAQFTVLSHALISQIDIHREYGGVFPAVAKREHVKNLVPLLGAALEDAELSQESTQEIPSDIRTLIGELLARESDMAEAFLAFITETERPKIDAITVTYGPGLAPALWVGVNFAKALSLVWNIPLVSVNHMEGHFLMGLAKSTEGQLSNQAESRSTGTSFEIKNVQLPILGLLISGGHTQLLLLEQWLSYKLLGETRDDAVGEAFDKVARMMGLPYPGGPEISKLAEKVRKDAVSEKNTEMKSDSTQPSSSTTQFKLPRPMLDSQDFNFSFSGLKTAVLYILRDLKKTKPEESAELDSAEKELLAHEFENAVTDVLLAKTMRALEETQAQTLVLGGGVSANAHIQRAFSEAIESKAPYVSLNFPPDGYSGDNAVMIAIAGFYRAQKGEYTQLEALTADSNLSL
jgi:N6-L-threonylcarbamoyladenine synthase